MNKIVGESMRLVMYISTTKGIKHLSAILHEARHSNRMSKITGIMSYNDGHYLQVIEGPQGAIETLLKKLYKDNRHSNLRVVLDTQTDTRYFPNWGMSLIPIIRRDNNFKELLSVFESEVAGLPNHLKSAVEIFYPIKNISKDGLSLSKAREPEQELLNTTYSVTYWPNFSKIQVSPELLTLCGKMMNNPLTFESLVALKIYPDKNTLSDALKQLQVIGCLELNNPKPDRNKTKPSLEAKPIKQFMENMRNFLSIRLG